MAAGRRSDDGFTLTELVVVVALLGFVIAGAWATFSLAARESARSNREAWMSREIGEPLEFAERIFSQQTQFNVVEPYRCEGLTDRDNDNKFETYQFEATTDGRLVVTSSEDVDSPTAVASEWSASNRNRAESVPLFRYYDVNGTDISGEPSTYIAQYATSLVITIVADHDGGIIEDSRRVYFRNR